ncbi:MAG: helix-turn-helix domain-containing protein [Spirochaetaceae bacterium]|jgi:transcriptional regulator with XRE-family HTH domain|nr:helix-turn-helix domain-containing protein [Spirochaetaceae bacterium]
MSFTENLREAIDFAGLKQKELAKKVDIPLSTLESYLKKENPSIPAADVAYRLAQALDVTVEFLVTGEDKRNTAVTKLKKKRLEEQLIAGLTHAVHKTVLEWG